VSFKDFKKKNMNEGGNLTIDVGGKPLEAQKIDMTRSTRKEFRENSIKMFKKLNKMFKSKFGEFLWVDEKLLDNGVMFNGSTSFIFSDDYTDDEIMAHKTHSGDIDVIIDKNKAADLWRLLKTVEGKEIVPGVEYMGNNRGSYDKLANQINSVFMMTFKNGYRVPAQVDFEMLNVSPEGAPDEFAKFAHSSSFEDLKAGQKGVAHKYLLISIAGGASMREDIFVVSDKSTESNYKIRIKGGQPYTKLTNLKFSVDHGLRTAFEKQDWQIDGKDVFIEKKTKDSNYTQSLESIFEVFFNAKHTSSDIKKMWSFVGLLDLMQKHLDKKSIKNTYDRMIERTIGKGAQGLERGNPALDFEIKSGMLNLMRKRFSYLPDYTSIADEYYKSYGKMKVSESTPTGFRGKFTGE